MMRPFVGDERCRTIDEERIVQMLLLRGWRFEAAAGDRATATAAAGAALERLVRLGLPFRAVPAGGRRFDPVEVGNFMTWAHAHLRERLWEDRCIATARREIWEPVRGRRDGRAPPSLEALGARRYRATIWRTFNLAGRRSGERVRLRLPAPLADPALSDLAVAFLPSAEAPVQPAFAPGRIDITLAAPEDGQVCIGLQATFNVGPSAPRRDADLNLADRELYTRASEGLVKLSPRVRAIAAGLAGGEPNPAQIVRRFWNFILDDLACGSIHYHELDPARPLDWIIEHGWYDCQVGSALMVALCRARQIPARLVTGYMLHVTAPAFHTWLEVWLDEGGWTPFDLESWELSAAGRDADWREVYFGRLDHRLVVERPPRLFGGLGAVRLPDRWHMLTFQTERGAAVTFEDLETGALVYREDIEVERLD